MARLELAQENSHHPLKVARLPFRHIRLNWDCAKIEIKILSAKFFHGFLEFTLYSAGGTGSTSEDIFSHMTVCENPSSDPFSLNLPSSPKKHVALALMPLVGS